MTNRYFTKSAKSLARETGVLLWDRDKILRMQNTLDNDKKERMQNNIPKHDYYEIRDLEENLNCLDYDEEIDFFEYDPRLPEAVDIVIDMGQASISILQRRMRIGYAKAGRLIDEMAQRGIVSEADGAKPRQVLITKEEAQAMFEE